MLKVWRLRLARLLHVPVSTVGWSHLWCRVAIGFSPFSHERGQQGGLSTATNVLQILAAQGDRQPRKARDAPATTGGTASTVEGARHVEFEGVVVYTKWFPGLDCRRFYRDTQEGLLQVCKRDSIERGRRTVVAEVDEKQGSDGV